MFALIAYIPMLASQPGTVSDDTKTYLYYNPGRLLSEAASLWDPNVALGTVSHQTIGYLLPMGPFYWLLAELHVPVWIAQRLWMGSILFAAGAGMLYLCRTVGLRGYGRYIAALGFMFTPYVLQYSGRISVILLPWCGLPWMIAFVVLALRRGGWRYPALFALVVALVSGINATSILYVGIGPALWLPFAVLILHEATWRKAWAVAWKVGLLSLLVSLWWIAGLQVEAAYGVNVLKYTESLQSTSYTSTPTEIIRGLGYWFFYGAGNGVSNQAGNWTQAAGNYTQDLWLVGLSFAVPTLAFAAAALVRWRLRIYFILLVVVGLILAVGPYPYYTPSVISGLIKSFMSDTTAGLALRSTDRASPLVLLSLAVLLGAGVTALSRRSRRMGVASAALAAIVILGASFPLLTGAVVVNGDTQPASPPPYVTEAASHLNHTHPNTRVYALPGNDFGAYRWGDTIDTVWPALLNRPFVTHEQQVMGSLPTNNLLAAADTPLQQGTMDPNTIAPIASLMSAGDVLVQYDQAYEKYNTPNPQVVAEALTPTPKGLSDPVSYGAPRANKSTVPDVNEQTISLPDNQKETAPLVSYTVDDPRPIVRAESLESPLIIDGDANGLVNASSIGLLADNPTIFYAGTLDASPKLQSQLLTSSPKLVITDTNRKQGYRWNSVVNNAGYTETASEGPDTLDPLNEPLNIFPKAPADAQTTTVFNGLGSVTASTYGSPVEYYVDERPAAALDGNTNTAWIVAEVPTGQWWQMTFDRPKTMSSINLVQAQTPHPNDLISEVRLSFDAKHPVLVHLGPASLTKAGQTITFPQETAKDFRITILGETVLNHKQLGPYQDTVGLAEVRIPGVTADEAVSMPQDLLRSVGKSSINDSLTLLMTRLRSSGFPPRSDAEPTLARDFWLPTPRAFTLSGSARVSPLAPTNTVNQLLGLPNAQNGRVDVESSSRLAGSPQDGGTAAIDHNPGTAWTTALGVQQSGQWVQYSLAKPITFDSMDLKIVADEQHSIPTSLIVAAGGQSVRVNLPRIPTSPKRGSIVAVPVTLPTPLTGKSVRVTVDGVHVATTENYYSGSSQSLPVAIAELGIPGLYSAPPSAELPESCRGDLLTIDGSPLWVSVGGTSADAINRQPLSVSLCGPDANGLHLGAGNHTIRSAFGQTVGFDIDQLTLSSAPEGGTSAVPPTGASSPREASGQRPAAPLKVSVEVKSQSATSMTLSVSGVSSRTRPFALVLGQSISSGWQATIGNHNLGTPILIDGFANGWRVDPATLSDLSHGGTMSVSLRWTPQRRVNLALILSALSILGCIALVLATTRRRWAGQVDPSTDEIAVSLAEPELALPVESDPGRVASEAALGIAFAMGVIAGLIATPLVGLVVFAASGLALRFPKTRLLLGFAAAGCLLALSVYVTLRQSVFHFQANGGWPARFDNTAGLAWAAVLFLAADATIELIMRRVNHRNADSPNAGDSPHDS